MYHSFLVSGKSSYNCIANVKAVLKHLLPESMTFQNINLEKPQASPLARIVSLKRLVTKRTVWWDSEQGHVLLGQTRAGTAF